MRRIEDEKEREERKRESNRRAVEKYQKQFKRINCRFTPEEFNGVERAAIRAGVSVGAFVNAAAVSAARRDKD